MDPWKLSYNRFAVEEEATRETLTVLGNGYFATRGAAEWTQADGTHYPGSYLAGCYNRLTSHIAGRSVENEDLVNLPNWLDLSFRIDGGPWLSLGESQLLHYSQELDLHEGIMTRALRLRDADGRLTRLTSRRFAHISEPHLAALSWELTAENWSGRLEIRSGIDARVRNRGVARYQDLENRHLETLDRRHDGAGMVMLECRTTQSKVRIALAARTLLLNGANARQGVTAEIEEEPDRIATVLSVEAAEGDTFTVEKTLALYSSRDSAATAPAEEAWGAAGRAGTFSALLDRHKLGWAQLWRRFDLHMAGDSVGRIEEQTMILRLHLFHLLQTVSPNILDLDVGCPARGLHGEAYRGHVFWDELFIFPQLNLRLPEITRALLLYRYRRLPEARLAARAAGYAGAMFPWQSASNGREETQRLHLNPVSGHWMPDNSHLQRHVNAAIAFNVWQFYQVTRDMDFLMFHGAEMMLDIARFFASLAQYDHESDRYEIKGVMGPDEYHDAYPDAAKPGIDNNAYTNLMAAWTCWRALDTLRLLPSDRSAELKEGLGIGQEDLALWDNVSRRTRVDFHDEKIISQFEGYADLEEFDWEGYRRKYGDIRRLDRILASENDSPNRYKLSKQADVLMLFYLFSSEEIVELFRRIGRHFDPDWIPANVDYYSKRTSHGSTLGKVVDAWVLSRSNRDASWDNFSQALLSDYKDIQGGTTKEGIHLGAMAGTADLIFRCYTGIETRDDVLWLNPRLPAEISDLRVMLRYRRREVRLTISRTQLRVDINNHMPGTIQVGFDNQVHEMTAGESRLFGLSEAAGGSLDP